VYEYLVPNVVVGGYKRGDNLRSDQEPCCPAILRANHQIYNEIVGMWYGGVEYYAYITGRHFYIHGIQIADRDTKLFSNFRFISVLRLDIMLHWPPQGQPQYAFERQKPWVTLISECLSAGPYKLSRLVLGDVVFYTSQVPTIVETYLNDRGGRLKGR